MRSRFCIFALALLMVVPAFAQTAPLSRDVVREKLRASLAKYGLLDDVNTTFRQSEKQPYNFVGSMKAGLKNAESLEVVISVTTHDTIGIRVYPHYNGGYINLNKARNSGGLMRKLLQYSDTNFLYWGADDTFDVFCGYTFTLESGYPEDAMKIVLRSIHNTDQYVGEVREFIDAE